MRFLFSLLAVVGIAAAAWPISAGSFPSAQGFVNDYAALLNESSRSELESLLRDTEKTTSAEVVLVTVRSLDGMTVEEYAVRLFEQWGIGKKEADNGVLILVSPTDRSMRIEVGYGLEPILPDGLTGEIIRAQFLPAFRDGDYGRGILQGVGRVVEVVRTGAVVSPDATLQPSSAGDDKPPWWLMTPFFALFVVAGSFAVGVGVRSKTYGTILWGGMFAGGPFFMSLIEFYGPGTLILGSLAACMMAWGYSKGGSRYWTSTLRGSAETANQATGWMAGTSRSSDSSGDGGSSGSSFGDGSSGGGGASGRW